MTINAVSMPAVNAEDVPANIRRDIPADENSTCDDEQAHGALDNCKGNCLPYCNLTVPRTSCECYHDFGMVIGKNKTCPAML